MEGKNSRFTCARESLRSHVNLEYFFLPCPFPGSVTNRNLERNIPYKAIISRWSHLCYSVASVVCLSSVCLYGMYCG